MGGVMRTVQMTIDDVLVDEIDQLAKQLDTSRSDLTRKALRAFLAHFQRKKLEEQQRQGYERFPSHVETPDEWEDEQVWGDNDATW